MSSRAGLDHIREHLRRERVRLETLEPEARVKQTTQLLGTIQTFDVTVASLRRAALRQLRLDYGWTYQDLADIAGTSRARIEQIVRL